MQCNIPLVWLDPAGWPNRHANFALGSASSQLQEVLVTDLPRSFNRGERETREGGGREGERWKREGEGEGEDRKGQVFQLSLQHLSDPSGSGRLLSKKIDKNITCYIHMSCALQSLFTFHFLCALSSFSTCSLRPCWQRDCRSQSHIPVTFIQC